MSAPPGSSAAISDPSAPSPTFVGDVAGRYHVWLTVDDGMGGSASDQIVIDTDESRPLADAGLPRNVFVGDTVELDGSASVDPDAVPVSYRWALIAQPAGSSAVLADTAPARPTFVADEAGVYVAQLIAGDGCLESEPATVAVVAEVFAPTDSDGRPSWRRLPPGSKPKDRRAWLIPAVAWGGP